MKKILLLALILISQFQAKAVVGVQDWTTQFPGHELQALTPDMTQVNLEQFLDMTPKKYREMTGKRLGLKKTMQLKAAQKAVKKASKGGETEIPKGLYIVGALLGWSWLIMGLLDDFQGNNWWVNLILLMLCFIPGVIHAFIKMKDYY
jgi:Proteolipid membrane potential modulator